MLLQLTLVLAASSGDCRLRCVIAAEICTGVLQDIFRVFDSLNYLDNLKFGLDAVMDAGGVAEGTICYTGDISDPRKKKVRHLLSRSLACCCLRYHTSRFVINKRTTRQQLTLAILMSLQYKLEYYLEMADALVTHGVHTLAIKDMVGCMVIRCLPGAIMCMNAPLHLTHEPACTSCRTKHCVVDCFTGWSLETARCHDPDPGSEVCVDPFLDLCLLIVGTAGQLPHALLSTHRVRVSESMPCRKQHPDVPIHVHTHDTAGTGVATQLACAMAGADIVDCAIDSMSGGHDRNVELPRTSARLNMPQHSHC
jgi:HMGL-like